MRLKLSLKRLSTVSQRIKAFVSDMLFVDKISPTDPITQRKLNEKKRFEHELSSKSEQLATLRIRAEQETTARIAALDQLRHADRLGKVGQLASEIAHELGTPLNVVSARAKMIVTSQTTDAEIKENAEIIIDQTNRMTDIISQLLNFSRRKKVQKKEWDIRTLVRNTLNLLKPLALRNSVEIESDDGRDAIVVVVDSGQIQQVIANVVMNAIQAQPRGGLVSVRTATTSASRAIAAPKRMVAYISVKDQGEGISPEVRERLFEPFFTTKNEGEGTGLGLSVSNNIVEEHGGWIEVESKPGEGSHFTIFLPLWEGE
jgi:two-component system, NtrC family, sensor kinase